MKKFTLLIAILLFFGSVYAQNDLSKDALVKQILLVESHQREAVQTVIFDAEYIEGEIKKGKFKEKIRFEKKIYLKYLNDTAFFHEEFLSYFKDGKQQNEKDLLSAAKEKKEKKIKRKSLDISHSMLKPFYSAESENYTIEYQGISADSIENRTCHHFKVTATREERNLINGDYYIESESFQLVRVDFSPAKLASSTMFKMKELRMSIIYGPSENNLWFPTQFDVSGKGKAMFFIGVKIAGTEYYRNPQININIDDKFKTSDEN